MSHMDRMSAEVMRCIGKIPMKIEERGEVDMCKAIDDMMEKREQKGIQEGRKEGRKETSIKIALNLLEIGISLTAIAQATGLSEEEIKSLQSS